MNGRRAPPRALAVLSAAVLGAHVLALGGAALTITPPPPPSGARPILVRTVAPPAPPAPQEAPAPVAAAPLPAPAPSPVVKAPAPPAPAAPAPPPVPLPEPVAVPAVALPEPAASGPEPARPPREPIVAGTFYQVQSSARLQYDVSGSGKGIPYNTSASLAWTQNGEQYSARLEVVLPLNNRVQTSAGRITSAGLAPDRFADKQRGEKAAHFDREKGRVVFSSNKPDAPLLAGAQDRLSVILQLGAMIGGAPERFTPATTIAVQTAGTDEADTWLFTVDGRETLDLPGGRVEALKLTRNPRREFDQKVELWLAPGMDYMPVRLRLTQPNGDSADQRWRSTDTR